MPLGGTRYQPGAMPGAGPLRPSAEPQEAVKVLNLRLPKSPLGSPVPGSLLTAAGGGGQDLTGLLRALMAAFQGGGSRDITGSGPAAGTDTGRLDAAPAFRPPRVRPGEAGPPVRTEEPPPPAAGASSLFDLPDLTGIAAKYADPLPQGFLDAYGGGRPLF